VFRSSRRIVRESVLWILSVRENQKAISTAILIVGLIAAGGITYQSSREFSITTQQRQIAGSAAASHFAEDFDDI
jgi:hypothetical protein